MLSFPEPAEVPEAQRASARIGIRYEDVAQDGSLKVGAMPNVVGMVCFRDLWSQARIHSELAGSGVVPILSRLCIESIDGPISVRTLVEARGQFQLAHQRGENDEVRRIFLRMHALLSASRGRTHDPQPSGAGEVVPIGQVYAEHIFTRPFAEPDRRRVQALDLSEGPWLPEDCYSARAGASLLQLPAGARWLEPEAGPDEAAFCFGLIHTDSNQHVNSLAYPQLFEEAALRRFHRLDQRAGARVVRHVDMDYRKPFFAGDRARVWLRAFALGEDHIGVAASACLEGGAPDRFHCHCRLLFGPASEGTGAH